MTRWLHWPSSTRAEQSKMQLERRTAGTAIILRPSRSFTTSSRFQVIGENAPRPHGRCEPRRRCRCLISRGCRKPVSGDLGVAKALLYATASHPGSSWRRTKARLAASQARRLGSDRDRSLPCACRAEHVEPVGLLRLIVTSIFSESVEIDDNAPPWIESCERVRRASPLRSRGSEPDRRG